MKLREIKGPRLAASKVLNAAIDLVSEAIEENQRLADRFQPVKEVPQFNVPKMVEDVKKLTAEYYAERRQAEGDEWFGNLEEWQFEAVRTLRDELCAYARKTGNGDLWWQIYGVWPEKHPPRNLTPEELGQLADLQEQFDSLMVNLEGAVMYGLEDLWDILKNESEIVSGTSGSRLLYSQAGEHVQFLTEAIKNYWLFFRGGTTTIPENFQREARGQLFKTRKWTR